MKIPVLFAIAALLGAATVPLYADQDDAGQENTSRKEKREAFMQERCGDDSACRNELREKQRVRLGTMKQHLDQQCGDDQACRDEMKEKFLERRLQWRQEARAECSEDKACLQAFWDKKRQ